MKWVIIQHIIFKNLVIIDSVDTSIYMPQREQFEVFFAIYVVV